MNSNESLGQVLITFLVGGGFASLLGVGYQWWRERKTIKRLEKTPRREKIELDDQLVATAERVTALVRAQLEELEDRLAEERMLRKGLEVEVAALRAALHEAGIQLPSLKP